MSKNTSYSELLKDPRWQQKRLKILERDEWMCQRCFDAQSTLHVHHRYYLPGCSPWEYTDNALVTLCEQCHAEESEGRRSAESSLIFSLRAAGALNDQLVTVGNAIGLPGRLLNEHEWAVLGSCLLAALEHPDLWKHMEDVAAEVWRQRRHADLGQQRTKVA